MDMHSEHFDIGTIQAFLDGELDQTRVGTVSSHIAACDNCALMLTEAEEESAVVFPALEREFNSLVPTQRLWNKINDSIETEKRSAPIWQKAWAYISIAFVSPSIAVAAGLLIVFGLTAIIWMNRTQPETNVAGITRLTPLPSAVLTTAGTSVETPPAASKSGDTVAGDTFVPASRPAYRVERASYSPVPRRNVTAPETSPALANPNDGMPGEDSYVKTIAALSKTADAQKDRALRPSERVSYERDMAMVNDSIARMRQEVKKNPKNDSAKQVLYSSYQNKIDLLNSVSQKGELMASLR